MPSFTADWNVPQTQDPNTGRPTWTATPDQHNWTPGQPGKGFILDDGAVHTWNTEHMRPMHAQAVVAARQALSQAALSQSKYVPPPKAKQSSFFHIEPEGRLWQYGAGRSFDADDRFAVMNLNGPKMWFGNPGDNPPVQADQFGHAEAIMPRASRHSEAASMLRYNPGQHAWKDQGTWRQEFGRGLLTPEGGLHTWPEGITTHADKMNELGYPTEWRGEQTPVQFHIRPSGEMQISDPGFMNMKSDPWIQNQIAPLDPRLVPSTIDPEFERSNGYDPDTGDYVGLSRRSKLLPMQELAAFVGSTQVRVGHPKADTSHTAANPWEEMIEAQRHPEWGIGKPNQVWGFVHEADYYHLAPTQERDRIQQHGLQPANPYYKDERWQGGPFRTPGPPTHLEGQPTGVYVGDEAQATQMRNVDHRPLDMWRIPEEGTQALTNPNPGQDSYNTQYLPDAVNDPVLHQPYEEWYHNDQPPHEAPLNYNEETALAKERRMYDAQHNILGNPWGIGMDESQPSTPNLDGGEDRYWENGEGRPKWSAYYHGAPTSERDRIMQHGLQPGNPQLNGMWQLQDAGFTPEEAMRQVHHRTTEPGVYMADGMDTAYKDNGRNDVWHINPDYIDENQLKRDPNWGNSGISPTPIPPKALTLQQPSEDAMWSQHEQDTAAQQLEQQRQERKKYDANKDAWGIGQPVMSREASSYWHVTDDPNFQVNPNQIPFDTNEGKKPGLFVSQDPHYWASMFNSHPEELASNEYENETPRGYLAEMNAQPEGFGNRGYGQEWFIDHPSQDQVKRVWPMQEGLNEYDRQAPDREQEAIQQWQREQEAMQQWQHTGALDFNPGGHPFRQNKQWMQEWGRGAITPDGEMHTWPESQALHNEMIHQLGFTPYSDDSVTFRISPQGQVRPQDVGPWQNKSDSWIEQQIASRDPRLNSGSVDPEWQRAQGWDPDTGEWIGGSRLGATHKIGGMPAEMVPIDALQHLREWDRRPGQDAGADQAYWDKLKGHIAEHGIEEPLSIEYNPKAGSGYLGEGNHRLAIAQELGMTHVPAYVYRSTKAAPDWPMQPMHQPGQYSMLDARGFSQFGQYMKPSDIGLPTAGPFESPSDDWYQQQRAERTAADIPGSEMGDANQHADPTEPRPADPGLPKGCTCDEGQKLECPIHGLNADPEMADLAHDWSLPEGSPVGYPQDSSRTWSDASV
jgi:hypothetical protein